MSGPSENRPGLIDNLSGSLDIMLGRANGMAKIDHSTNGFWLSFWGVILMMLIDASGLSMIYNVSVGATEESAYSKPAYIFVRICIALLAYLASFLALYLLCRSNDEQSRFPDAVIVNNWAAAVLSLGFLPLIAVSTMAVPASNADGPPGAFLLLVLASWAIVTIAGVRILKTTLEVSIGKAIGFFATTTLVSIFVNQGFQSLVGL